MPPHTHCVPSVRRRHPPMHCPGCSCPMLRPTSPSMACLTSTEPSREQSRVPLPRPKPPTASAPSTSCGYRTSPRWAHARVVERLHCLCCKRTARLATVQLVVQVGPMLRRWFSFSPDLVTQQTSPTAQGFKFLGRVSYENSTHVTSLAHSGRDATAPVSFLPYSTHAACLCSLPSAPSVPSRSAASSPGRSDELSRPPSRSSSSRPSSTAAK